MAALTVSALTMYPVKSCAGISLQQAQLDRFGVAGDRRWMLVDGAGRFISQRQQARLALLRTRWRAGALTLSWADESCTVAVPRAQAARHEVTVWGDAVSARDAGDPVANWLQQRLGLPCRLVHMPDDWRRPVDAHYARAGETVSFADGFPLLLIAQASLDDLNGRLPRPVPMNRFRPNIVIGGCPPFAEDHWRAIRIGGIEFSVAKPCSRCVIPSIDQQTAKRDRTINRVLASFRRRDGTIYFGQNLLHRGPGTLRLDDPVELLD